MNYPELLAITGNLLKAWEESRVQGAISCCFAYHRLKTWRKVSSSHSVSVEIAISQLLSTDM